MLPLSRPPLKAHQHGYFSPREQAQRSEWGSLDNSSLSHGNYPLSAGDLSDLIYISCAPRGKINESLSPWKRTVPPGS